VSDLQLFVDLTNRRLVSRDGGAFTHPPIVAGDAVRYKMRTYERTETGDLREVNAFIRSVKASVGRVEAAPENGVVSFKLDSGSTITEVGPATTAVQLEAKLNAVGKTVAEISLAAPACWLVRFATDAEVEFEVEENTLRPSSFPRWRAFREGGLWWHELRLVQYPVAFTEAPFERILPDPPVITRVREGRGASPTEPAIDEIQKLFLPRDFRGTYFLRWEGRVSSVLGIEDGSEEIAAALDGMFGDGRQRWIGSNPEVDHAYLQFTGPLAAAPQELIEAEVNSTLPGPASFTLDFNRPEAYGAVRAAVFADLQLELELELVDSEDDLEEPSVAGRIVTVAQQVVRLVRETISPELATVPNIDWLRAYPKDYAGFTPDQIITGVQQTFAATRGNGTATSFALDHGLATADIKSVVVINASTGAALVQGTHFNWTVNSASTVTATAIGAAPATNGWKIYVSAAGPASVFQAHTHTIGQIVGLQAALDAITGRLDNIEELLPATPAARVISSNAIGFAQALPPRRRFFPGIFPPSFDQSSANLTPALLRRPPALLPALHVSSVTTFSGSLPGSPTAGTVYQNTGSRIQIAGAGGRPRSWLEQNGFAAWDARGFWYRLTRDVSPSATTSYFPTDFEQDLWTLAFNARRLRAGQRLTIEGKLDLATFAATTNVQCLLVVELGTVAGQSTPSTTGENLENVVWNVATPLLSQRVILTGITTPPHEWGVEILRKQDGSFESSQGLYRQWEAGGAIPAAPDFAIRMRLVQWDTENAASTSAPNARGYLFFAMREALASIA
jgi:hypothetical protein